MIGMPVTMHDIKPVGLCITTLDMFDTRRFLQNYGNGIILRGDDPKLKVKLTSLKRELNAFRTQPKFFEGYKAVISNNIDKILSLVKSRHEKDYFSETGTIVAEGNRIVEKVLKAEKFDDMMKLEHDFKKNVVLPTYRLFIGDMKRRR